MAYLIRDLTKQRLQLIPNSSSNFTADVKRSNCDFDLKVVNASEQFASFQVELIANGTDPDSRTKWYSVEPKVCAKKPPGDTTQFHIVITKAPIPTYDVTIPILVRVFSVEYESISDSQTIELAIKKPDSPLKVYLPIKDLKVYPGDRLDIPVIVYNLSPKFTQVTLMLEELDPSWFIQQQIAKTVQLEGGTSQEVIFQCSPPKDTQTESRVYEFSVKAEAQPSNSTRFFGRVEVLPYGVVEFYCPEPSLTIPRSKSFAPQKTEAAEYQFQFTNLSNVKHQIALQLIQVGQPSPAPTSSLLELEPGASIITTRTIQPSRPWLGWGRQLRFEAVPTLTNIHSGEPSDPIYVDPNVQTLDLEVRPRIPLWLQLLTVLLGLLSVGLLWWLTPPRARHRAPVNSVRIMNDETTVVSGSSDRTVLRWDVNPIQWIIDHHRLSYRGPIARTNRAVRVIREMPKREGQIAVGMENGEIQLWQVSSTQEQLSDSIYKQNDRVFDLDFTPDSRNLFSAHGSGLVRRWNLDFLNSGTSPSNEPAQQYDFRGAVSALSVIDLEPGRFLVAIVGQYNKFALWDWQLQRVYEVNYGWNFTNDSETSTNPIAPVNGKSSYINTLSVAKNFPLLAMADNHGYITLWSTKNLKQCMTAPSTRFQSEDEFGKNHWNSFIQIRCGKAQIDRWQAGRNGQSIRSIALSEDGCYLASVGDDGQVLLWLLKDLERRSDDSPNFILLERFAGTPLRAVDIEHAAKDYVLVATDAPKNQVRLYRQNVDPNVCSSDSQNDP